MNIYIIIIIIIIVIAIVFLLYLKKEKFEINDINHFLKKYKNKKIIYIPNPGNAGDSLIAYGTLLCFKKSNLNYVIGDIHKKYNNEILFYAGGGSFVGIYAACRQFLNLNHNDNEIVILPHTIKDEDETIMKLGDNVKIFCRERISYEYVKKILKNKSNVFLSKDMAFYIKDLDPLLQKFIKKGTGEINCYRTDVEKTDIVIPKNNFDLSQTLIKENVVKTTNNVETINQIYNEMFGILSNYDTINTNRLHIAISGYILNKNVIFSGNSYYKNKSVYDYSLKNSKNIKFIEKKKAKESFNISITPNTKIFYINLDDNTDRKKEINSLFEKLNFQNYERFSGINTKTIEKIDKYRNIINTDSYNMLLKNTKLGGRKNHHELTNGSIGCYLSHFAIYEKIVKQNIPFALIFEDDLTINIEKNNFWNYIYKVNIPEDADILLLDAIPIPYKIDKRGLVKIDFFLCLHSYLITNKGAKKLLKYKTPIKYQLDSLLSRLSYAKKINVYLLNDNYLKIKQTSISRQTSEVQNLYCPSDYATEVNIAKKMNEF